MLTGGFGLLLAKAAINVGPKQTRWRRELTLDVELLGKLREAHAESTSTWDLEQQLQTRRSTAPSPPR